MWQDNLLKFKLSIRIGKKGHISSWLLLSVCQTGLLIPETAAQLEFLHITKSFLEIIQKKRRNPVSGSRMDKNTLFTREVGGEWTDWLRMIQRQQ